MPLPISLQGPLFFRIRFNTQHGDTGLYWRILIGGAEYLTTSINCQVRTYSESSFDDMANAVKYHMAGEASLLEIDEQGAATLS